MTYDRNAVAAAVARGLGAARDRAQPGDAGKQPEDYARLGEALRVSAWRHLGENDPDSLPQASNKGWGMVAETIKAVSAHHGGFIHAHRSFLLIMRELSELARGQGDIATAAWLNIAFDTARALHSISTRMKNPQTKWPTVCSCLSNCRNGSTNCSGRSGRLLEHQRVSAQRNIAITTITEVFNWKKQPTEC